MHFLNLLNRPRKSFKALDDDLEEAITAYRVLLQAMKRKSVISQIPDMWNSGSIRKVDFTVKDFENFTSFLLEHAPKMMLVEKADDVLMRTILTQIRDQMALKGDEHFKSYHRAQYYLAPINFERAKKISMIRWDLSGLRKQVEALVPIWKEELGLLEKMEWSGDMVKDIKNHGQMFHLLESENIRFELIDDNLMKLIRHIRYLVHLEGDKYSTAIKAEEEIRASIRDHIDIIRKALKMTEAAAVHDLLLLTQNSDIDFTLEKPEDLRNIDNLVFLVIMTTLKAEGTYRLVVRKDVRCESKDGQKKKLWCSQLHLKFEGIGIPVPEIYTVDEDRRYIFEEYVQGITFEEFVRNMGNYNHPTVTKYMIALGRFVAIMHNHHLVHNDLYGKNIMIELKGEFPQRIVFIDFEFAYETADPERFANDIRQLITTSKLYSRPEYFSRFKEGYISIAQHTEYTDKMFDLNEY